MSFIEREVTITSEGHRLSGTVCLPRQNGRFPTVLMLHGSGPRDRNENMREHRLNVFNQLAHYLAGRGIASLRYDKRGSAKSSGDYYRTGLFDVVNDAVHWVDALKDYDACDPGKIFLLGHSEGCMVAPLVSLQRPEVAGLVLLGPFVEDMESILIRQATLLQREFEGPPNLQGIVRRILSRILGLTVAQQRKLLQRIKSSDKDMIRARFVKIPAKSIRELIRLDPPSIFRQVAIPMLLVGGGKDIQCHPEDVYKIAELASGPVEAHVIENLSHVLRLEKGQPTLRGTLELLEKPVEPGVLELVAAWLEKESQAKRQGIGNKNQS
jgi:pimeloyl-ACP methyl ester carboxylesterase